MKNVVQSRLMTEIITKKIYDLAERTMVFAKNIRRFVRTLPHTISNDSDVRQLIRSSGSIGANYLEASESLSKKDFTMRIKISRKEAKESIYWLKLIDVQEKTSDEERHELIRECTELMKIFGSIVTKSTS